MAFVHRAKRSTGMPLTTTPSALGPGAYSGELVSPSNGRTGPGRLSYAPFASSAERGMLEERYSAVDFTPGPGEYSARFPGQTQGPSISTSFVSSVPRFGRDPDPSQQAPGPGAYQGVDLSWAKQGVKARARRRDGVPGAESRRGGGVEWVRVSAPPSIPAPTQSFGYEENALGELVLQRPARQGHAGLGLDTAGPGEYLSRTHEHPLAHERKRGFVEWSKSRTHREMNIRPTGLQQPGPGAYLSMDGESAAWAGGGAGAGDSSVRGGGRNRGGAGRQGGKKVSAFFASQSKRLRDDGGVGPGLSRDPVPGPGTYAIRSEFDQKAAAFVPEQYQFFGSKTGRTGAGFGSAYAAAASNPTPGPGAYQVKSSIRTGAAEGPAGVDAPHLSFSSTSTRFGGPGGIGAGGGAADLPGPGAYVEPRNTSLELSKRIFGRNTSFGTTEARFHAENSPSRPGGGGGASGALGPGVYETNTSSIRQGKKPLSVFVSATRRFDAASGRRADEQRAAVEAAQGGAASFAESVPRGIGSEPTWGNGARSNPSAAFANPRQPRFDDRAETKSRAAAAAVGPGRYDPNPGANLYRSAPAVAATSAFKATQRDQAGTGNVYRKDVVPGPGTYAKDVTQSESTLIKRSFNITIAT